MPHTARHPEIVARARATIPSEALIAMVVEMFQVVGDTTRVNHSRLKHGSLDLDSTATRYIFADEALWLRRPIHQGTLTTYPFLSSLAG